MAAIPKDHRFEYVRRLDRGTIVHMRRGIPSLPTQAAVLLGVLCALLQFSCGRSPTTPGPAPVILTGRRLVDFPLAWSPDGSTIVYRRLQTSRDGPPGVYLLRLGQASARYVMPANLLYPRHARFSRDGRQLVLSWGLRLYFIDCTTLAISSPFYTSLGADYPDWLQDGQRVIYERIFGSNPESADSDGVHVVDLVKHTDTVVHSNGGLLAGHSLAVSPDSDDVAMVTIGSRILLIRPDGTQPRTLFQDSHGATLDNTQWIGSPVLGDVGISFTYSGSALLGGNYIADMHTGKIRAFPEFTGPFDVIARDGSGVLTQGIDPRDSTIVVFIRPIGDLLGRPPRQVTRWIAP